MAGHGAVGEAGPDEPGERRVVARAAADDDRWLARRARHCAHHAAVDAADKVGVGIGEAADGVVSERAGLVDEVGHGVTSSDPSAGGDPFIRNFR